MGGVARANVMAKKISGRSLSRVLSISDECPFISFRVMKHWISKLTVLIDNIIQG